MDDARSSENRGASSRSGSSNDQLYILLLAHRDAPFRTKNKKRKYGSLMVLKVTNHSLLLYVLVLSCNNTLYV